ncbi:Uncharacterised protein [Mycobacteroides abscessus subsp. abscessus]|nr:Uncharacterised protein [Mycobacteroides abscessus subsp. abscessus]
MASPQIQNAGCPVRNIITMPSETITASEPTMMPLEPNRVSTNPPTTAPTAAITFPATPNSVISAPERWNTPLAITGVSANIATIPSRKIALATRK